MKISIEFSKQNIIHLLKATFVYSWVVDGTTTPDEPDTSVDSFEQMIFGLLYNSGMKDEIMFNEDSNLYFVAKGYEDEIIDNLINKYNNNFFWEELTSRLAIRDFYFQKQKETGDHDEHDHGHCDDPDFEDKLEEEKVLEERIRKISAFEDKYWDEFEKHGLENLKIFK